MSFSSIQGVSSVNDDFVRQSHNTFNSKKILTLNVFRVVRTFCLQHKVHPETSQCSDPLDVLFGTRYETERGKLCTLNTVMPYQRNLTNDSTQSHGKKAMQTMGVDTMIKNRRQLEDSPENMAANEELVTDSLPSRPRYGLVWSRY